MSDARQAIFGAIRAANPSARPPAEIAAEADSLVSDPHEIRPMIPQVQRLSRFRAKATSERVTATLTELSGVTEVPDAVRSYLAQNDLGPRIALQPTATLSALEWRGIETHPDAEPDEPVGVSLAEAAIAETGSVVFRSGPDAPVLLSFLPLHHIVVVPGKALFLHMEEVFRHFGTEQSLQRRNLNIVTGTSGTADIEAKNIRGAHGPRFMHLLLCPDLG